MHASPFESPVTMQNFRAQQLMTLSCSYFKIQMATTLVLLTRLMTLHEIQTLVVVGCTKLGSVIRVERFPKDMNFMKISQLL
jgi:hypothetical protein